MPSETTTTRAFGGQTGECSSFSLMLAEFVDPRDADGLEPLPLERHLSSCLRCQAELAQYRKLLRSLSALRAETVAPDDELLADILARVRPDASVHRLHRINYKNRKAAYIGGIAAAATGMTAGALVLATKLATKQRLAS